MCHRRQNCVQPALCVLGRVSSLPLALEYARPAVAVASPDLVCGEGNWILISAARYDIYFPFIVVIKKNISLGLLYSN